MQINLRIGGLDHMSPIPPKGSIPPSVRQGRHGGGQLKVAGTAPKRRRSGSKLVAENALEEGKKQESSIVAMLNDLLKAGLQGGDLPEFDRLNVQLGQVQDVIRKATSWLARS